MADETYRTREQVGELVDALLLVEIDTGERVAVPLDDTHHRSMMPTVVLKEATTDRSTVEAGLLKFAGELLWNPVDEDDDP